MIPYQQAWDLQRILHDRRVAGEAKDTVLLLQHPPVFTAGRRTLPHERPRDGTPVVDVDRGGKITWHGPGQLVGYPIVALPLRPGHDQSVTAPQPGFVDVVGWVRSLEEVLIATCADFDLATTRVVGRSGVWTADGARKVAAIGIRVSRGVTMHGFALNCNNDLSPFDRIVPCGIPDAGVTSLTAETGDVVTVDQAVDVVKNHLRVAMAGALPCPA